MKFIKNVAFWFAMLFLAACSSGGSSDDNSGPDLMVFLVSGHTGVINSTSSSYLNNTAGPGIIADLRSAGYKVEFEYYIDNAVQVGNYGGFQELVGDMEVARDQLQSKGTKSIVIAHSHGAVWAHAAIAEVDDLTVTALVDLDASSFGWNISGHSAQNSVIGGNPEDRFNIAQTRTCSSFPSAPSDGSASYDLEDVVFPNVQYALEVRGSQSPPLFAQLYDEKWNVRTDGNTDGLSCYYSNTSGSHAEVHYASGSTIAYVKSWLKTTLAN